MTTALINMKKLLTISIFLIFLIASCAQRTRVETEQKSDGWRLLVNGEAFMVNGMNWDYFPIGTNYMYSLWDESDAFIQKALDDEMTLLKKMGVNAIRVYTGIPQKWIKYIYENYGIYTMLNHSFGRYGLMLEGEWAGNTDYADPRVKEILLSEVKALAKDYQNTPGLLLYLLGNENNYGLFWGGAETEDIPIEDRQSTIRARHMYQLFNEAALAMKSIDPNHPVAICNGDLLFLDIIAEECQGVDIFGINVYRGVSFTDMFDRVKNEYGKPILLTELGADAYNDITQQGDQCAQAFYLHGNWREIYENAAGLEKAGNALGGFTFQSGDGWWKYGQTVDLDVHNTNASWGNGGYLHDFVEGKNNMNEEWFGICAKGPTDEHGHYSLIPRTAYYVLKEVHRLDPYAAETNPETIRQHFNKISFGEAYTKATGGDAGACFIGETRLD
jgi:hypothetical protein